MQRLLNTIRYLLSYKRFLFLRLGCCTSINKHKIWFSKHRHVMHGWYICVVYTIQYLHSCYTLIQLRPVNRTFCNNQCLSSSILFNITLLYHSFHDKHFRLKATLQKENGKTLTWNGIKEAFSVCTFHLSPASFLILLERSVVGQTFKIYTRMQNTCIEIKPVASNRLRPKVK